MRLLIGLCLLTASLITYQPAKASDGNPVTPAGSQLGAEPVTDAKVFLAKIDETLALAYSGQYGNLKRGSGKKLEDARGRIAARLEGQDTIANLPLADRLEIQNAEDLIASILRNKERDRMVCRRDTTTGTRFATTECMTIANREARAKAAAQSTDKVQRNICYPGEGQDCK